MKNILIIKGMGLGDALLGIPLFRSLRRAYPSARIHVMGQPGPGTEILRNCPYVDEIIDTLPLAGPVSSRIAFLRRLRKTSFDLIIDSFPTTTRTAFLSRMLRGKKRIGFANNKLARLYDTRIPFDRKKSMVDIESGVMTALGSTEPYDAHLEVFHNVPAGSAAPHLAQAGIIEGESIVCIAAGKDIDLIRTWPADRWARVIDLLAAQGMRIVFIGADTDNIRAEEIRKLMTFPSINLINKLSLGETTDLLRRARLLLAINGGAVHLAAALHRPQIVLSGSSGYFWDPHDDQARTIRTEGLACMPCESFACKIRDKYLCMRQIQEPAVKKVLEEIGIWKP